MAIDDLPLLVSRLCLPPVKQQQQLEFHVSLAIFDLDNTLLGGDSDYLWGQFLTTTGAVDKAAYEEANQRFFDEYKQGTLDIFEFLRFSLKPLSEHDAATLEQWHHTFMTTMIDDIWLAKAEALVNKHRDNGDTLMIITATNRFVTQPIAQRFGISELLATEPEFKDGRYTGEVSGTPCFQDGKVTRLQTWLKEHNATLEGSYFYSDSHNDLPLLKLVEHPVAVDPDEQLNDYATAHGWSVISLRE